MTGRTKQRIAQRKRGRSKIVSERHGGAAIRVYFHRNMVPSLSSTLKKITKSAVKLVHAPRLTESESSNFPLPPLDAAWLPSNETVPNKLSPLSS